MVLDENDLASIKAIFQIEFQNFKKEINEKVDKLTEENRWLKDQLEVAAKKYSDLSKRLHFIEMEEQRNWINVSGIPESPEERDPALTFKKWVPEFSDCSIEAVRVGKRGTRRDILLKFPADPFGRNLAEYSFNNRKLFESKNLRVFRHKTPHQREVYNALKNHASEMARHKPDLEFSIKGAVLQTKGHGTFLFQSARNTIVEDSSKTFTPFKWNRFTDNGTSSNAILSNPGLNASVPFVSQMRVTSSTSMI